MTAPPAAPNPVGQTEASTATRVRNLLIVLVAIVLSTTVFLGLRTQTSAASLSELAESAVPLEAALTNGKPTLMEFYANWCTSCQAMAQDMSDLKAQYDDRMNFVMLNVDNTKWLPEMLHYRVDGIPHFVFLNASGEAIASTIGEQPRSIMAENLNAIIAAQPLPHGQATGQVSQITAPPTSSQVDDPRSHGNPVVPPSAK
jgi:thiol-disulfide isomerase/thioredoxin